MRSEDVDVWLAGLRKLLVNARSAEYEMARGITRTEDWDTGLYACTPSDGITVKIKINGGARETYERVR